MKEVIISADGDSKVYLVPDVVANVDCCRKRSMV